MRGSDVSAIPNSSPAVPAWKFSAAIAAAWLVGFLPLESSPIWIPAAQIHYGVSPVAVGLVASVQSIVASLSATFIAPWLAKRPLRKSLLIAMSMNLLAALGTATLHPGFAFFILLRVIDAAGAGVCIASGAILASRTPKPSRSFGAMQFSQIIANMVVFGLSTKLVVQYGLPGLYYILVAGMGVLVAVMFFSKGWPAALLERPRRESAAPLSLRIILGCCSVALIYCGFIALVSNANSLGGRAGIDFAHVTMVLAITTAAGALGSLIAIVAAGRVRGAVMITLAAIGTAGFGLFLVFGGFGFAGLTASLCGVIMFIYVALPNIYTGIAAMDLTGRSAALTQASQILGPVVGPAVGAMIAVHSVTVFAGLSGLFVTGGIVLSAAAAWPSLQTKLVTNLGDADSSVGSLGRIA
jgi:predicted MFS family arabinose efflux permease